MSTIHETSPPTARKTNLPLIGLGMVGLSGLFLTAKSPLAEHLAHTFEHTCIDSFRQPPPKAANIGNFIQSLSNSSSDRGYSVISEVKTIRCHIASNVPLSEETVVKPDKYSVEADLVKRLRDDSGNYIYHFGQDHQTLFTLTSKKELIPEWNPTQNPSHRVTLIFNQLPKINPEDDSMVKLKANGATYNLLLDQAYMIY